MLQIMFQVIVLLVMFSCLPSFTAAEAKIERKEKDELTKKISQQEDTRGRITDARGETDLAKLWQTVAQQSETVAQLEMKVMNSDEELRRMEMQMRKTKKELVNKIRKMEMQMENKDKIIRQLDQKLAGPVEPLAKFLIEAGTEIKANTKRIVKLEKEGAEIKDNTKKIVKLEKEGTEVKNNTKRIAKCENGFCGTCQRPYGAKMIPLKPYLGSHYAIYNETLVWITARAACANHGGQLASMETNDEWQFIFEQLKSKDSYHNHWIGAQKLEGGGTHEGFQWLTGVDISKDNSAWASARAGGKCLLARNVAGAPIHNNWLDYPCHYTSRPLCEFK